MIKVVDLKSALQAIKLVEAKVNLTVELYVSDDDGHDWYFNLLGRTREGNMFFDCTFRKHTNSQKVHAEMAHTSEVTFRYFGIEA